MHTKPGTMDLVLASYHLWRIIWSRSGLRLNPSQLPPLVVETDNGAEQRTWPGSTLTPTSHSRDVGVTARYLVCRAGGMQLRCKAGGRWQVAGGWFEKCNRIRREGEQGWREDKERRRRRAGIEHETRYQGGKPGEGNVWCVVCGGWPYKG